jgi:hypothetical protein
MEKIIKDDFGYFYRPISQDILDKENSNLTEYIKTLQMELKEKNRQLQCIPIWIKRLFVKFK